MTKQKTNQAQCPIDYFIGQPRIEIYGNQCIIEGINSILEYSSTTITVKAGKKTISLIGDGLQINSFTHDGTTVTGNIESMELRQ